MTGVAEVVGMLIGEETLPGGGVREIVFIESEQRPQGGPASGSMVAIIRDGASRVGGYVPWINYYDVDEEARRSPKTWRVIEPAREYREIIHWWPYGGGAVEEAPITELRSQLAILRQIPAKLQVIVAVTGTDVSRSPQQGTPTIEQTVLDVIAADAVRAPRALQIATRDGVRLPSVEAGDLGRLLTRVDVALHQRLYAFDTSRRDWVLVLEQLSADELQHRGRQEDGSEVTVLDVVRALTEQERAKLTQLASTCRLLGYDLE